MEENHHHGTDSKPANKFIQIDSIFIDLFSSDEKCDDQKCEIFSIRGHVSDKRKKDWRLCWPFSDMDDGHKLDDNILSVPPVYDPSFDPQRGKRHWQESSDKAADQGFVFDSCHNFGKFSSDSPMAPKQDVINGRTMADNASNSSFQPFSCDQKEEKLEVADNCTVALISQSEPGCASHEVPEIEPVSGNLILKATEKSLAPLRDGKRTAADHLNGQLSLVVSENDSTVDVDREHHTVKFQENGDASMESYERTVSSSESAETVGNRPRHCYLGKLRRRRAPKIRLLTELLGENGNMKAKHVESSPSNGTPEASLQADVRNASKCQVTVEEMFRHSDRKRGRTLPRNRKFRHQEVPSSSSVDKQIQAWRGEIESSVSSLGTENALSGIKKTMTSPWSSYKMDGNNSLRKKKSKFPVVDPYSMSLMPSDVKDQCEIRAITEYRSEDAVDGAAILAHYNEFSSRTSPSISLNAMESKSSASKNLNSSKESVIFEGPTNVFPWNNEITWRSSVTQMDVETMKCGTVANPFQYADYKNNDRELHLSPNNYSNPERNHKGIHRRGENELPTLFPERDDASRVSNIETTNLGDPNHPYQASDVFYEQRVHSVLNSKMANLKLPLSRQNADPNTHNNPSQLQNKNTYRRGNGKRTIEAQDTLAVKKRQINQRADQASDRGTSDDIPMEIVELMAKNQYERRLPDAENNKHVSETGNFSRAVQVNNYGDIYRNGKELLQKPEHLKQNAQAWNRGNGPFHVGKVMETRKQKSADNFSNIGESHFNTTRLQQNHMFGHYVSIPSQEEQSNGYGIQYSSIGSKRKGCAEIRRCNGTMVESGPYNSKVQSSEDHLPISEQNIEAAYTWRSSSLMTDLLSDGYQRFPAHSTDSKKISSLRSLQMGSANAQNCPNRHPTCLERRGRENNPEAYSQKFADSSFCHRPNVVELHQRPVGSLELYSNETISAMHLLSLMHARTQSNAPMTLSEMHKSSKKPPVPRPPKDKEFSAMDICFNETIQDINQVSSTFQDEVRISATSASASTFQHGTGIGTYTHFSGQAVFKSQNGAKMKCLDPSAWSNDPKPSKLQFRNGDLGTGDRTFPVNGIQKGAVNASSNSKVYMLAHYTERNTEERKLLAQTRTLKNEKSTSETEICSVNKNPADFSSPEAGNIYMIGAEDFNFGRTLLSKNRSSSIYSNNRYKQQRIV